MTGPDDTPATDVVDAPTPDRPTVDPAEDGDATKPSFAGLAHTIRRRTSDLLAIGILVVAALAFGRELSGWWDADEPHPVAATEASLGDATPGWNDPGRRVEVRFGDGGLRLHRERIVAGTDEAIERLVTHCGTILARHPAPTDAISPAEARMLATTADLEPALRGEGWAVHLVATPMPTAIGVLGEGDCPTCGDRRAICWGLLMGDVEPETWTAFWFDRRNDATGEDDTAVAIALPDGARRTMSLRDVTGAGGVVGFEGTGSADAWTRWFDEAHPATDDWTTTGWRRLGPVRVARYDHPARGTVEVRIESAAGGLVGLVAVETRGNG